MSALEIVIHSAEGKLEPITEEVAAMFDALVGSVDWGSQFLCVDDIRAIAKIGSIMGWELPSDWETQLEAATSDTRKVWLMVKLDGYQAVFLKGHPGATTHDPFEAIEWHAAQAGTNWLASAIRGTKPNNLGAPQELEHPVDFYDGFRPVESIATRGRSSVMEVEILGRWYKRKPRIPGAPRT